MHPMRHPRNVAVLGVAFVSVAAVFAIGAPILDYRIDWAGVTMLGALGVAISIMAYVLIAGSSRD